MLRNAILSVFGLLLLCGVSWSQNLDAHWTFDTDFTDSSGNGHNGTAQGGGAVIDNASFEIGSGALSVDGAASSWVQATGYKGVTGTAARTVSAWIKVNTPVSNVNQAILAWGTNSGGQKWTFRIQDSNGTSGALRTEVNGGFIVGTTPLDDGNWHQVAATFIDDGTPNVQDVLLYVDGQLNAQYGGSPAPSADMAQSINTASSTDVRIGARQSNTNDNFDGLIDDAGIFTAALSPEKVAAIYSLGTNADLGYNLGDDDALFALFDSGDPSASVEIDGLTWQFVASGLSGTAGQVDGANGNFSLLLNATDGSGLQTLGVPEPASIAIWSLLALVLTGYGYYRRRR